MLCKFKTYILRVSYDQAGFLATHMCIVTDAQAAATFCQRMLKFGGKELGEARVTAGQKYLILDVGGMGTGLSTFAFSKGL